MVESGTSRSQSSAVGAEGDRVDRADVPTELAIFFAGHRIAQPDCLVLASACQGLAVGTESNLDNHGLPGLYNELWLLGGGSQAEQCDRETQTRKCMPEAARHDACRIE
jgi:hypothetical protein